MSLSAHTDIHIGNFVSDNTVRKDSISSYAFATEANGRFRSVTSEVGASTLDYDCNVAIILLDAVRNLRWQFGSNPETSRQSERFGSGCVFQFTFPGFYKTDPLYKPSMFPDWADD